MGSNRRKIVVDKVNTFKINASSFQTGSQLTMNSSPL